VRRIVTGHNTHGHAVFRSIDQIAPRLIESGYAAFATVWSAAQLPVDLNDESDGGARDVGLTLNSGSVIRVVDMLPGGASPMHRTNSLDYGIVTVSYTHLTLPTILRVYISVVAARLTNNKHKLESYSAHVHFHTLQNTCCSPALV